MLRLSLISLLFLSLCSAIANAGNHVSELKFSFSTPPDTGAKDSTKLKYPIKDEKPYVTDSTKENNSGGVQLKTPPNMEKEVKYNPITRRYETYYKVGDTYYRSPKTQSFEEYYEERKKETESDYFKERSKAQNFTESNGLIPKIYVQPPIFDKIFGGGVIDIRPSISAELTFGGNFNTVRNPAFTVRQQRTGQFDFNQKIQMNINGSIGERLKINMNYDTEATFDFDNQVKLDWVGKEDDIIKKVELGNVSLPLNGTLIQGGQSLFGIKTQMQFGKLLWTAVVTSQKGETSETEVRGGAQVSEFNIQANEYDVNRHYFLGHFFRENYDRSLSNLPVIQSGAIVTRVEVWVTNRSQSFNNTRDVLALSDLAESRRINNPSVTTQPNSPINPDNSSNDLYSDIVKVAAIRKSNTAYNSMQSDFPALDEGVDYELVNNMRLLSPNEYTLNAQLGYISLNFSLNNDEVLAVAYEYTFNGNPHKVGEFTRDVPNQAGENNVLFLKTLKSNIIRTNHPIWDLMMKNIYSLGTFNIKAEDFQLNVIYADDPSGADLNYLPVQNVPAVTNRQLISVFNLDKINKQKEPAPDGVFDIIEGVTINSNSGRIIFPVVEPFGTYLNSQLVVPDAQKTEELQKYYVYQQLYDSTKWIAQQDVAHNKFFLRGSYKGSSSNEISLNAINVPEGSVKVTANGTQLTEGSDYIVDYTLGKVTIINTGILNSGAVIKVTSESNSLFNIQQKTLLGSRFDYKINKDFLIGATVMHLYERPLTPKVNIGDEPLLNTMLGFDGSYTRKSLFLTKLVDKLPFVETKEPSTITLTGEYAAIIPGQPKTIGQRGTSYIDDFEAAETPTELKRILDWKIASVPLGQPDLFPETATGNAIDYSSKRAQLAWYTLDPTFFRNDRNTPDHIKNDVVQQSDHFLREVKIDEVFPNKQIQQGSPQNLPTFDLAYYPKEKGPYNFNVDDLQADGTLAEPDQNWAGIMRRLTTNDFEAANIDYLEIWVMDPYYKERELGNLTSTNNGALYINFGSVSEDVLPDGVKSFENGLPKDGSDANTTTTQFGKISTQPTINNAFDNDPASRPNQDVGLDGLTDVDERVFWEGEYLEKVKARFGANSQAYINAFNDPANDNYQYYRGPNLDDIKASIFSRYKRYNGTEGNSTLDKLDDGTPKSATNTPDDEDINKDFSLNRTEDYYQYKIDISMQKLVVGENYVTDKEEAIVRLKNGKDSKITWFQLKVPIREFEKRVGSISDFKSIRFMRMFLKGFQDSIVFRFGQLQLIRADWRRYLKDLSEPGSVVVNDPNNPTEFVVSTVNIEENGKRTPIPYVVPPTIYREIDVTSPGVVQKNEQSISLRITNLQDGDARGAFKTTNFDIRNYKTLKMYVHAESREALPVGKLTAFIRLGTDLSNNYYEYEVSLTMTPDGSSSDGEIWPESNEINIDIEQFLIAKQNRDPNSFAPIPTEKGFIRVVGLPDLSNVRVIMLGIRNPEDDGRALDGEVWFNELRLANFTNKGGWAANMRMVTQLADFATVNLSGSIQTIGFGGIDKKLNERNLHETYQYDANTSVELGKFFNQKLGITIPMYVGYSETYIRPKFNPLNPDIELKTALATLEGAARERVKNASEDYTSRYGINFINVRKNRVGNSKAHIYDIENFNVSYSYQNTFHRNQTIEHNTVQIYEGGLGYNYGFKPKYIQPFRKVKGKYLQLIKDINFSYLPQNINVSLNTKRYYSELLNRNNDNFQALIVPFYDKNFTMTRNYSTQYNLARSLKLTYSAVVNARIDEPIGKIDSEAKRDSIRANFFKFGRTTNFDQRVNASYAVPLNKIPLLNWVTLTTSYGANYSWVTAPPAAKTLGNTIQNSRTQTYNGNFNLIGLYNKIPYFREASKSKEQMQREKEREKLKQKRLKQQQQKKEGKDEEEEEEEEDKGTGKEPTFTFGQNVAKFIMMVKNASLTLTYNDGTALPGFTPKVSYLGQNWDLNAPGRDFILGSQNPNLRYNFAERGYLTNDTNLNNFFINTSSINTTGRMTVEPFKDFRIDINFTRTETKNTQSIFRYNNDLQEYLDEGLTERGTYSTSFNTWSSAFEKLGSDYSSATFDEFRNNRYVIAQRLQVLDPRSPNGAIDDTTNFPAGYSGNNQNVLISAFLAAYTGKNAATMSLSAFPSTPKPNWRINYTGLSKMDAVKAFASNVTLSHGYSNTYTVANYQTSTAYNPNDTIVVGEDLEQELVINTVSISERFAPLLGVDVTFNSGLTTKLEYKKDRTLALLVNSFQLTETRNKEYVFGLGYKKQGFRIPFKINGGYVTLENDLTIRVDVSIRDGVTIIRKIDGELNEPTGGNKIVSIKPTIDYMINDKLNFQFFYDRRATKPAVSNSFPTAITQTGIRLRYTYS